jgi:hypothetical protein
MGEQLLLRDEGWFSIRSGRMMNAISRNVIETAEDSEDR